MPTIARITIGNADGVATEFGFGAGPLGDPRTITSEEQAHATLSRAWDLGVRYFDTAPWYGHTKSEHRVGQFLRTCPRDEFVVSTKVGRLYSRPQDPERWQETEHGMRWAGGLPFVPRFDYSASGIRRSYEDSLQRLGLNRVDFLVVHDLDPRHQRGEAGVERALEQLGAGGGYQELAALRARGEVSAIGVGVNHVGMIPRFVERFDPDFFLVAMPYTLLDQDALDGELQLCVANGIRVVIGAVFASGILATGAGDDAQYGYQSVSPEVAAKVGNIEAVGKKHAVSLPAAAMQFPLAHPAVAAVIPGAESPEQVQSNVAAYHADIPRAYWESLRQGQLIRPEAPLPGD